MPLKVVPNAPTRTYAGTKPVNQSFVTILFGYVSKGNRKIEEKETYTEGRRGI